VLFREGDYVGSNVNIASRLAAEAKRHQVLVTSAVRDAAKDLADVGFARVGKRRLKGLADEVVLFEAQPITAEGEEKMIDVVCGMELRPAEVAARLSLEGQERVFCSDECLRQFVASPEKYGG
jgi:YHS domain-containing protein